MARDHFRASESRGALCITRYEGQRIFIGDDIEIQVFALKKSRVSLRISAPYRIPITIPTKEEDIFDRFSHGAVAP